MQTVATNIRFSLPEYRGIKRLALAERRSVASLIREALREYKKTYAKSARDGKKLFQKLISAAVAIDIPTTMLVSETRKFE